MKSFLHLLRDLWAIAWALILSPCELIQPPTEMKKMMHYLKLLFVGFGKLIQDNLRILVGFAVAYGLVWSAVWLLGRSFVAESSSLSTLVAMLTVTATAANFLLTVFLFMWFGLAFAWREANAYLLSDAFDKWWSDYPHKGLTVLVGAAVIGVLAAICLVAAAVPPGSQRTEPPSLVAPY